MTTTVTAPTTPAASSRSRLRRAWKPVLVVLGLAAALLLPEVLVHPVPASGDALLPDHIAGYSPFTADVRDEPPGRGVLIFTSGSSEMSNGTFQRVVVGADASSYRQTSLNGVLSPDGSSVLFHTRQADRSTPIEAFDLVDLRTGSTRHLPIPTASAVIVYAWSPNGRFVAYGHLAWPDPSPVGVSRRQATVRDDGWFSVLDLSNGSIVDHPGFAQASAVAFAPDSTTMAVQTGERVMVVNAAGQIQRELPRPTDNLGLLPDVGWAPDGQWIALVTYSFVGGGAGIPIVGPQGNPTVRPGEVTLVDATGSGRAPRGPYQVSHSVLGWRSADSLVQFNGVTNELSELSLTDRHVTHLAIIDKHNTCELPFFVECETQTLSAATGLLQSMRVVPARWAQRSRALLRLELTGVVIAATVFAAIVAAIVRRRRRPAVGKA